MGYTKLDARITDSTIWQAPDATRLVWITMLAMADQHGYVGASMPGLAGRARVPLDACIAAITMLESPDEWSRTKEHDGRRIAPADGGWVLLNHAKYREMQSADDRRERSRLAMAELRARRKAEQQVITSGNGYQKLTKLAQAEAEAEADTLQERNLSVPSTPPLVDCPHLRLLELWKECLPEMPQHTAALWTGTRKTNMRVRWRELVAEKGWRSESEGLDYFRQLFLYIGQSRFLTGRSQSRDHKPFFVELEWLIKAANWAKVLEGKYHQSEAA
jgi:hypothetical protein